MTDRWLRRTQQYCTGSLASTQPSRFQSRSSSSVSPSEYRLTNHRKSLILRNFLISGHEWQRIRKFFYSLAAGDSVRGLNVPPRYQQATDKITCSSFVAFRLAIARVNSRIHVTSHSVFPLTVAVFRLQAVGWQRVSENPVLSACFLNTRRKLLDNKDLRRVFFVCPSHWDKNWDKLDGISSAFARPASFTACRPCP